jgi:hypothetical protein
MSDVPERYVELGLRLGRHLDGLVDAYFGPPEIAARIEDEELRPPAELARDASDLLESLDGFEESRRRWLRDQLVGLETVARKLAGEEIPYHEEVERCYGVRPERVPEEKLEEAHRKLEDVLPGSGTLSERYQAWREAGAIPADKLSAVIESLIEEVRARTSALLGLPDGEAVVVEYVTDEPWSAFNYYEGGLRSRVAVNTDVPITPAFVAHLISHETYPGHHTEKAWKELLLVRERDQLEETILMIGAPQSTVAEGIATLAPEIVLGDEEQDVAAEHLAAAGVAYDPEVGRAVNEAARPLRFVRTNAALMVHADGVSEDDTLAYLMHWGLISEQRAEQALRFMTHPVWRSYGTTYTDGYRLSSAFVDGDPARSKRLLTEQLTPADLKAGV